MTFEYLRATSTDDKVNWDSTPDDNEFDSDENDLDAYLKARGTEGWELVSVLRVEVSKDGIRGALGETAYMTELFFKRQSVSR